MDGQGSSSSGPQAKKIKLDDVTAAMEGLTLHEKYMADLKLQINELTEKILQAKKNGDTFAAEMFEKDRAELKALREKNDMLAELKLQINELTEKILQAKKNGDTIAAEMYEKDRDELKALREKNDMLAKLQLQINELTEKMLQAKEENKPDRATYYEKNLDELKALRDKLMMKPSNDAGGPSAPPAAHYRDTSPLLPEATFPTARSHANVYRRYGPPIEEGSLFRDHGTDWPSLYNIADLRGPVDSEDTFQSNVNAHFRLQCGVAYPNLLYADTHTKSPFQSSTGTKPDCTFYRNPGGTGSQNIVTLMELKKPASKFSDEDRGQLVESMEWCLYYQPWRSFIYAALFRTSGSGRGNTGAVQVLLLKREYTMGVNNLTVYAEEDFSGDGGRTLHKLLSSPLDFLGYDLADVKNLSQFDTWKLLASGSTSIVFKGTVDHQVVVAKALMVRPDDDSAQKRRYDTEKLVLQCISEIDSQCQGKEFLPKLVKFDDDQFHLYTSYCGHTNFVGSYTAAVEAQIWVDVISALYALHSVGFVHRDVRIGNIGSFIGDHGAPARGRLFDFGYARRIGEAGPMAGSFATASLALLGRAQGHDNVVYNPEDDLVSAVNAVVVAVHQSHAQKLRKAQRHFSQRRDFQLFIDVWKGVELGRDLRSAATSANLEELKDIKAWTALIEHRRTPEY